MARLTRHLVVLVKAPLRGAVKRRLARTIGRASACRFYKRLSTNLAATLSGDGRWSSRLAVTPDRFAARGRFWPARVKRVPQGRGDLGARMMRPMRDLPPGPVVIVGSDVPDLGPRHVAAAFRALARADAVFGPANDGGYWLVGFRRRPTPWRPFRGVAWSTERALCETRANLPPRFRVELLAPLHDVDDETAWRRWRQQRRNDNRKRA